MRILGIMLVKDEADVLRYTVERALQWIDRIFILDNGSSDGTWEIANELSGDQVVPWKQDFRVYSNALRAEVFGQFRQEASDGDWWCYKMDSDEFYLDDPREFLARVPRYHQVVYKRSIDYVITRQDVEEFDFAGDFQRDRLNLRYFLPTAYTEPRFFRHRSRLHWPENDKSPRHMGIPHPEPITVQHYQWRSPQQMQKRIDARKAIPRDKRGKPFKHVQHSTWEEALYDRQNTRLDDGSIDLHQVPLKRSLMPAKPQYLLRRALHGLGILP